MKSLWAQRLEICFFLGLVFRSLFVPLLESKLGRLGLSEPDFRSEGFAKRHVLTEIVCMDLGVELYRFFEVLGTVCFSFVALETNLKIG